MRKIRDLPANEHPREKLLEEGAKLWCLLTMNFWQLFLARTHRKMNEAHNKSLGAKEIHHAKIRVF